MSARKITFNGNPISEEDARAAIVKIYGENRVEEILAGLATGLYGCASVEGGYLVFLKPSES